MLRGNVLPFLVLDHSTISNTNSLQHMVKPSGKLRFALTCRHIRPDVVGATTLHPGDSSRLMKWLLSSQVKANLSVLSNGLPIAVDYTNAEAGSKIVRKFQKDHIQTYEEYILVNYIEVSADDIPKGSASEEQIPKSTHPSLVIPSSIKTQYHNCNTQKLWISLSWMVRRGDLGCAPRAPYLSSK